MKARVTHVPTSHVAMLADPRAVAEVIVSAAEASGKSRRRTLKPGPGVPTAMKNPITPEGAASAQNPLPPVPTTKILAISHFMGTPMTPAQRAQIMPHEVHDTVNAYLAGKIDQWYFRTDGKGVVFIVNATTPEEAKNILEKFPLGQAGLMGFDYIPLGPLSPLRIINDMVK
jgi:hypothetical protein